MVEFSFRKLLGLAVALSASALFAAAPAFADDAAPALNFTISVCDQSADAQQEAADQRVVEAAWQSFVAGSFPALERHLPRVRQIFEHAPACYPDIERRGNEVVVRTDETAQYLVTSALIAQSARQAGERIDISMHSNVYPQAALILGSYNVEYRHFEEAIQWLDRGLALQPNETHLISEKVSALQGLGRHEAALALVQGALTDPARALTIDRSRYLRISGVILIDLQRLDEAEAALNESIRLEPNNPGAVRELEYITELRRGAAQRDLTITAPNAPTPQTQ